MPPWLWTDPKMNNDLCPQCQNFDIQAFARDGYPFRGYPLQAVVHAAIRENCAFCGLLLSHLEISHRETLRSAVQKEFGPSSNGSPFLHIWNQWIIPSLLFVFTRPCWVHFCVGRSNSLAEMQHPALGITKLYAFISSRTPDGSEDLLPNDLRFENSADSRDERAYMSRIDFNVAADQGTPANVARDVAGTLITRHPMSSSSYAAKVKAWHENCSRNHPTCNKTLSQLQQVDADNAQLPKRCIQISGDSLESITIKLCETEGRLGKYITLSHRWNDFTTEAKTLRENYDCRLGICTHKPCNSPSFSPLITETASFAWQLGVRYLWIDSICIVQDDTQDWNQEALKMSDYYQNAWLTIAATATNSEGGLPKDVEVKDLPQIARLPYRNREGGHEGYFYLQCAGKTALVKEYTDHISESMLLRRGWVYQEWLLSRRILAMSGSCSGFFLQCQNGEPETVAGDVVMLGWREINNRLKNQTDKSFKSSMGMDFSTVETIFASWEGVIQAYSSLEMTKMNEDRLLALAGVAKEYYAALQARLRQDNGLMEQDSQRYAYACGHWAGNTQGLLWEQATKGPRRRIQGIPTWSWASIATSTADDGNEETVCGVTIRWANSPHGRRMVNPRNILCSFRETVYIHVSAQDWQPNFQRPVSPSLEGDFGNLTRFAILKLHGRLVHTQIFCRFSDANDVDLAAEMTGRKPEFGRRLWRKVALEKDPDILIGWASIEHPDYQRTAALEKEGRIFALFLRRRPQMPGGWGFGNLWDFQTAFDVLFLRRVKIEGHDHCYERLGVGRMFGNEVEESFEAQQGEEVNLV